MNRLTGKYALITGASQGLGLQMAIALASDESKHIHGQRFHPQEEE